jgi:transcriptional regulator with XRE-family HTH domain
MQQKAPTLTEMLQGFSPDEQARVERNARALVAESQTLAQVRKALRLTQEDLAKAMATTQSNVAQIERKDDILVSTLSRIVKALGGELDLIVKLPHHGRVTLKIGASKEGRATLKEPKVRKRATRLVTGADRAAHTRLRAKAYG